MLRDCLVNRSNIRKSGARLFQMVSDVLDFSRIESGEVNLEEVDFDLVALCRQMAERMASRCLENGQVFEAYLPPAEAPYRGDERLIKLALNHLLSNAVKYTNSGSISVNLLQEKGQIEFSVTDTGIGMQKDVLDRIFEPFYTTKDVGEGTGLGLSMVYGFVNRYGGEIILDTRPGEGATFRIVLNTARIGLLLAMILPKRY